MVLLIGVVLKVALHVLFFILVATYFYFKWSFQYWKRRGIPQLDPVFPFGNRRFNLPVSYGEDFFYLYNQGKERGKLSLLQIKFWSLKSMTLSSSSLQILLSNPLLIISLGNHFNIRRGHFRWCTWCTAKCSFIVYEDLYSGTSNLYLGLNLIHGRTHHRLCQSSHKVGVLSLT